MHHCPGDMGAPHDVMRAPPPLIFYFLDINGGVIKKTEVDVVAWFNPNRAEVPLQTHPIEKMESNFFRGAQLMLEIANGGSNECL